MAFQWFFTLFSALPGRALASSTHRLPHRAWALTSAASSLCDHAVFLMSGLSWLCQRSRHCLPTRPGKRAARADQWPSPWMATSLFFFEENFGRKIGEEKNECFFSVLKTQKKEKRKKGEDEEAKKEKSREQQQQQQTEEKTGAL